MLDLRAQYAVIGEDTDLLIVSAPDHGGGVASAFQRASQNRFVYTVEHRGLAGLARTHVELRVTFKDP